MPRITTPLLPYQLLLRTMSSKKCQGSPTRDRHQQSPVTQKLEVRATDSRIRWNGSVKRIKTWLQPHKKLEKIEVPDNTVLLIFLPLDWEQKVERKAATSSEKTKDPTDSLILPNERRQMMLLSVERKREQDRMSLSDANGRVRQTNVVVDGSMQVIKKLAGGSQGLTTQLFKDE